MLISNFNNKNYIINDNTFKIVSDNNIELSGADL